jgi:DNA-binding NarL/FixJ family response regulator
MRDGLRALLRATPRLEFIGQADNSLSALEMVMDCQPFLILLDSNLPEDEVQSLLEQTKINHPHTRCVVLANDVQQQYAARTAGADSVLLAGFPVARFFAVIEELLTRSEAEVGKDNGQ